MTGIENRAIRFPDGSALAHFPADLVESFHESSKALGFGGVMGFGSRPALILVDFYLQATGRPDDPYGRQIEAANELIAAARAKSIPIAFMTVGYTNLQDAGLWLYKFPMLTAFTDPEMSKLDPRLDFRPEEDIYVVKHYQSSFFGTTLSPTLSAMNRDTLIVTGGATGGCVRATAQQGLCEGFRPMVVVETIWPRGNDLEGEWDRANSTHMLDMGRSCADLVTVKEVIEYFSMPEVEGVKRSVAAGA